MQKQEKLMIIFVMIALFLVVVSITLLNTPEEESEACLNAGYRWDPIGERCIKHGKPIYCKQVTIEDVCITVYQPVCGWFDTDKIRCVKYPCARTFSNDCYACANTNVLYYTEGECPA